MMRDDDSAVWPFSFILPSVREKKQLSSIDFYQKIMITIKDILKTDIRF